MYNYLTNQSEFAVLKKHILQIFCK